MFVSPSDSILLYAPPRSRLPPYQGLLRCSTVRREADEMGRHRAHALLPLRPHSRGSPGGRGPRAGGYQYIERKYDIHSGGRDAVTGGSRWVVARVRQVGVGWVTVMLLGSVRIRGHWLDCRLGDLGIGDVRVCSPESVWLYVAAFTIVIVLMCMLPSVSPTLPAALSCCCCSAEAHRVGKCGGDSAWFGTGHQLGAAAAARAEPQ